MHDHGLLDYCTFGLHSLADRHSSEKRSGPAESIKNEKSAQRRRKHCALADVTSLSGWLHREMVYPPPKKKKTVTHY